MKVLRILLYVVLALVAIIAILGFIAPKELSLERSTTINAPADIIFSNALYFDKNKEWSPWMKLDPEMTSEVVGTDGTVGAIYKWDSDHENVGQGQQTITKIKPNQRVDSHLKFIEPWESEAEAYVVLDESGDQTRATWGFKSNASFPMNIMMMFMDVEGVLGKDYEKGLSMLKEISESEAKRQAENLKVQTIEVPARFFVAVKETIPMSQVQEHYAQNLDKVKAAINKAGIEAVGMPCGLFYSWDEETGQTEVAQAIPVSKKVKIPGFETIEIPAGKNLLIDYYGDYASTEKAHIALDSYVQSIGTRITITRY